MTLEAALDAALPADGTICGALERGEWAWGRVPGDERVYACYRDAAGSLEFGWLAMLGESIRSEVRAGQLVLLGENVRPPVLDWHPLPAPPVEEYESLFRVKLPAVRFR